VILKKYQELDDTHGVENLRILGIDMTTPREMISTAFTFYRCDVFKPQCEQKIHEWSPAGVDLILSDLAPKTGGNLSDIGKQEAMVERVFELNDKFLHNGGNTVIKVFQSENTQEFVKKWESRFDLLKLTKPKASQAISKEMYLVGIGFKRK
jgi:23S rRNA (uridine2552-2'-O)-methyltransferase